MVNLFSSAWVGYDYAENYDNAEDGRPESATVPVHGHYWHVWRQPPVQSGG